MVVGKVGRGRRGGEVVAKTQACETAASLTDDLQDIGKKTLCTHRKGG